MRLTTLSALVATLFLMTACEPDFVPVASPGGVTPEDTEEVATDDDDASDSWTYQDADTGIYDTGEPVVYEDLDQDGWTGEFDCNDSPLDEDGDGRVDGYWINPDADEVCDNVDNDCNGQVDDGLETSEQWPDLDGDGFGDFNAESLWACDSFPGTADNNLDCNDQNDGVNPDAEEVIGDGIDSDCDELTAPGETDTGETDVGDDDDSADAGDDDDSADTGDDDDSAADTGDDDDSAGTEDVPADDDADGFTVDADCDDSDAAINPDAIEYDAGIDGIDNNCDGSVDEDWQATVAITYNSYVAGAFNTALYNDGSYPNAQSWIQESVLAVDGTEAEVEYLSSSWDVSAQCGLIINGEGSSQAYLCEDWDQDPDFTLEVWWLGTSYDQDDLTVWIADDSSGECALILQVSSDISCDPIDDVVAEE